MNEKDFEMTRRVTITVDNVERKFLLARFHHPGMVMDMLTNSINGRLQGIREVKKIEDPA